LLVHALPSSHWLFAEQSPSPPLELSEDAVVEVSPPVVPLSLAVALAPVAVGRVPRLVAPGRAAGRGRAQAETVGQAQQGGSTAPQQQQPQHEF